MHPLAIHLILVAAGAIGVLGHPTAAAGTTPALQFWEEALPGTPVPDVIADLVQKGMDHSPLVEHYPVTINGAADQENLLYNIAYASCRRGCQDKAKLLPAGFYFQQAQVRVGSTMTVYLPAAAPPNPILPRDVASRVPFSNLPDVLAKFNIAPSSAEAAAVGDTLSLCEAPPAAGEQKACATSLEATVGGATRMLAGGRGVVYWAASSALPRAGLPLRQYAVKAVTPLAGDRHVGCHGLPYPYAVYYCHMTGRPTKAYAVTLAGDGGSPPVTMAALCHLDTSDWDPAHPAFEMLHTRPGGAPVCHFMSYANLLFGAKAAANS